MLCFTDKILNEVISIRGMTLRSTLSLTSSKIFPYRWKPESGQLETVPCPNRCFLIFVLILCWLATQANLLTENGNLFHFSLGNSYIFGAFLVYYHGRNGKMVCFHFNQMLKYLKENKANEAHERKQLARLKAAYGFCLVTRDYFNRGHWLMAAMSVLAPQSGFNPFGIFYQIYGEPEVELKKWLLNFAQFLIILQIWKAKFPFWNLVMIMDFGFNITNMGEIPLLFWNNHACSGSRRWHGYESLISISYKKIQLLTKSLNQVLQFRGYLNVLLTQFICWSVVYLVIAVAMQQQYGYGGGGSIQARMSILYFAWVSYSLVFLMSTQAALVHSNSRKLIANFRKWIGCPEERNWARYSSAVMEYEGVIDGRGGRLEALQNKRRIMKFLRKCVKSWCPVKVQLFSNNFFDSLTPLVLVHFSIDQALSLILVKGQ